ncbi:MAG: hypothetical protein K2J80_07375 [Oscillospiraceae bacterium]|nr:hypothetical protein [Oscillospiraceae bacterium]
MRQQKINVIIHMPEDQKSLDALQEKTNELFCKIAEKKFRNAKLTAAEQAYIIKQITVNLKATTSPHKILCKTE